MRISSTHPMLLMFVVALFVIVFVLAQRIIAALS